VCFGVSRDSALNQKSSDPMCTMKKIWCVVGQENVFANIQEFENPALIDFDFDDKKLWQPFLTPSIHKVHIGPGFVQNDHV
jgi:hypothetical protein